MAVVDAHGRTLARMDVQCDLANKSLEKLCKPLRLCGTVNQTPLGMRWRSRRLVTRRGVRVCRTNLAGISWRNRFEIADVRTEGAQR
jgi:hypothetical protein